MGLTKYVLNVPLLIDSVKERPCIWDKTCYTFKDRYEKHKAWLEICEILEDNYSQKSEEEQEQLASAVLIKWNNVRDAFMKSLKRRSRNPEIKEYVFHQNLQFLMKVIDSYEGDSNSSEKAGDMDENDSQISLLKVKKEHSEDDSTSQCSETENSITIHAVHGLDYRHGHGRTENGRHDSDVDVAQTSETSGQDYIGHVSKRQKSVHLTESMMAVKAIPDEDEAFFLSIASSVKRMTEDEKLEFRIGVLNLIKNIKQNGAQYS